MRRAKAFAHILANIPITIRDEELIGKLHAGAQGLPDLSRIFL